MINKPPKRMTLNKKIYIYALTEENSDEYRYVGKTIHPFKRLKDHIHFSKLKKTHKDMWIQKCILNKININIIILEETTELKWQEREQYWIKKLKNKKLTNHTNGGLGGGVIIYKKTYNFTKKWVQKNLKGKGVNSARKWYDFIRNNDKPKYIPSNPKEVYLKRGWISWGDFLGTNNKYDNNVRYSSYEEAKKWVQKNIKNIDSSIKWRQYVLKNNIPENIPRKPQRYYLKRGWISWGDFLGTNRIHNKERKFINYEEAKTWILENKIDIKSKTKWDFFCKDKEFPNFIPKCPQLTYKNRGWISWDDFLKR